MNARRVPAWLVSALLLTGGMQGADPRQGAVLFRADFEGSQGLAGWSGAACLEAGHGGGQAVVIERRDTSAPTAAIQAALPADAVRGCTLLGSAWVKAEAVSAKPEPWNGIKFMVPVQAPSGAQWPQASVEGGTFDWRHVRFAVRVPPDATSVSLLLGLEAVTGRVWFDDVEFAMVKPRLAAAPRPAPTRYKGHSLPRLRGAMVNPRTLTDADLRTLGLEWNANLVRWQLVRQAPAGSSVSLPDWDRWLDEELKRLDALLPACERYGLRVVLDLHSPPGGRGTAGGYAGSDSGLFADPACQEKFVEAWERMARRYLGVSTIWGFDLANEPVEDGWDGTCDDWQALAARAAAAIQRVDPGRTLILEPAEWGSPAGLKHFMPLDLSNVVYSVHMYMPHAFTHQGVYTAGPPLRYPGEIQGKRWDKAALRAALQPAIEFQESYNVHIYVGEFSAIRWAPDQSAFRYLSDLIEIMEELGWDWSYHAFREWHGWSVEHGEDRREPRPAVTPPARQELLRRWFAKNVKPGSAP